MRQATVILRGAPLQPDAVRLRRPTPEGFTTPEVPQVDSLVESNKLHGPSTLVVTEAPARAGAIAIAEREKRAHAEGFDAGREAGYREGLAQAQREWQQQAEALAVAQRGAEFQQQQVAQQRQLLDQLLHKLPVELEKCLGAAEDDMLALAFEVVCRMLGKQAADMDGLRAMLGQSLEAWHGRGPLSLHLHPDDLELLRKDPDSLQRLSTAGFSTERDTLHWVADPQIALGGCLLRSTEGALDSRLEVQLDSLKACLLKTRKARKQGVHLRPENSGS